MKNRMILFLGAPGAGKGTQAALVVDALGIETLSTGNILRKEVDQGSKLGNKAKFYMDKGDLVPDEVVNGIVADSLKKFQGKGLILDGFPRNLEQAKFLDDQRVEFDLVVYFDLSLHEVQQRMGGRRICKKCGDTYNIFSKKPIFDGICDSCGDRLIIRRDDKPEVVKDRYENFLGKTQPLLDFYEKNSVVVKLDANSNIEKIKDDVIAEIVRN